MPVGLRFVGIIFSGFGFVAGMLRFYFGIKPEFLEFKVFAVYSSYIETKVMETITTNLIEELTAFLLMTGLFLIAFSRERNERPEYEMLRLKSFYISAYLNFLFLVVSLFLTFGFAFVSVLMINLCMGLLIYIIVFRILRFRIESKKAAV
jgi:hypothetical protein